MIDTLVMLQTYTKNTLTPLIVAMNICWRSTIAALHVLLNNLILQLWEVHNRRLFLFDNNTII